MRKPLLIIFALVIVLLLIFLWVYLLFFRTAGPAPIDNAPFPEVPATFPDGGVAPDNSTTEVTDTETPLININDGKRLHQLTTRPVSGFTEVFTTSSTTPTVRYAEAGTGIIFDIDINTGLESTVTTFVQPQNHLATFSPQGNHAVLQTGFGKNTRSTLGLDVTSTNTARYIDLPTGIEYPMFIDETTLIFIERTNESAVAQSYNIDTADTKTLFIIPFREAVVGWGTTLAGPHYAYPKPSARLEGFALEIINGNISRLPIDGFGFTMEAGIDHILYSKRDNETYRSFVYDKKTQAVEGLPIVVIPDKCDYGFERNIFTCGHEFISLDERYPDEWYTGQTKFNDLLWNIEQQALSAENLIDLSDESGRQIDTTGVTIGSGHTYVYFTNKLDGTLWSYEPVFEQDEAQLNENTL